MVKINKREPGNPPSKHSNSRSGNNSKKKKVSKFFGDPLLVPRINKYLANRKDQLFIDVNDMVNDLQAEYREYARRKRAAFRPLVEQAFSSIVEDSNTTQANKRKQIKSVGNSLPSPQTNPPDSNEPSTRTGKRKKTSANSQLINLYSSNSASQNKAESAPKVKEVNSSANLPTDPPDPNEPSTSTGITRKNSASSHLTHLYSSNSANRKQVKVVNSNSSNPELIEVSSSGEESRVTSEDQQKLIEEELRKLKLLRQAMGRRASNVNRQAAEMNRQAAELFGDDVRRQRAHRSGADILPRLMKRQRSPDVRVTFADFASDTKFLEDLCRLILHVPHPEIYRHMGVPAPCGLLLHGPPGCGKTLLAHAIAGEMDVELIKVSGPELIGGVSGESEQRIRDLFDRAYQKRPCVLFIDEVDTITLNRELAQKEMEKRIVAQLLTCLDSLSKKRDGDRVLVIGATNRPDSLDPALRRAGRFDREVSLGIPDVKLREKILRVLCSKLKLGQNFSFEELAQNTPGFVGADLLSLTREASMVALNRIFAALEAFQIQQERNKRRRLQRESSSSEEGDDEEEDDEDEDDEEEDEDEDEIVVESDDELPEILAQNIILLRQAREAISQNKANEQHSLQTRMGRPLDVEAGEGPSSRMDANEGNGTRDSDEVSVIDLIQSQEERAVNENMVNEITEQANLASEPDVAIIDDDDDVQEAETNGKTSSPKLEESNSVQLEESSSVQLEESRTVTEQKSDTEAHGEARVRAEVVDITEHGDPEPGIAQRHGPAPEAGPEPGPGPQAQNENEDNNAEANDQDEIFVRPSLGALIAWLHDRTPLTCRHLRNICITQDDFRCALQTVQPSAKREGFATVPDVTWDDIGSLAHVRDELKLSILAPVQFRQQFELLGLRGPAGILICGPPGCGKTLLAKAVANEAGINFISVKGPELLNMYVGESERAVRRCFQRARNSAPCVIFFDELDALCPRRSEFSENGASRVVNQLLTEMDGVEDRQEVYLMAATNRPDIIDPAVLRPGRLDRVIYVGLPEEEDRVDILRAVTRNGTRPRLDPDVNLEEIARRPECVGFSGADLAALVREAGIQAVQDYIARPPEERNDNDLSVSVVHFERALQKIRPSVSAEDRLYYEAMKMKYQPRQP